MKKKKQKTFSSTKVIVKKNFTAEVGGEMLRAVSGKWCDYNVKKHIQ